MSYFHSREHNKTLLKKTKKLNTTGHWIWAWYGRVFALWDKQAQHATRFQEKISAKSKAAEDDIRVT